MEIAQYIQRIEIEALWAGGKHIVWNLRPDVNILSGVNGVGKSTILRKSISLLKPHSETVSTPMPGIAMTFAPAEATSIRYDVIRSFDRPLMHADLLDKLADGRVVSELDWQLYQLQRRYLDYQVNVGNRMVELLTSGNPEALQKATEASRMKTVFFDTIDELFGETGKKIVRTSNEIEFEQGGERLSPYLLSSGEKQMLVILLTVLVEDGQPYALFMDEPEVSLHIEWQQRLITLIRTLNPQAQIILTTHSPAVIMNGWLDAVTEVNDIIVA